jgi:predicted acylesterase/phospholipase RssA/ABC-type phosphate/phosphonate transport system substrate-binding protein
MAMCEVVSALFLTTFACLFSLESVDAPIEIRVGIVAYQDSRADVERFQQLLQGLAAASPRPLEIRFALGTYGDVLHWMNRRYIDVAVMSPGIFAETLKSDAANEQWRYLATMGLRPAESALADDDRRKPGYHYQYRAVCVVHANSPIYSTADLRRAAQQGAVQFLFVHPLSVSGRIAPEYALRQLGIRPTPQDVQYTYSHSNSLRFVTERGGDQERVAFVWDDAPALPPDRDPLVRRLELPELASLSVPQNAIAARPDFEHAELVTRILFSHTDADGRRGFEHFDDWAERYGVIQRWATAIELPADAPDAQTVSLDELGSILVHFARSQPQPPRIALVLSGGGAKCAYQVGAVAAVEEKLAELRRVESEPSLDLGLVVGTSGGAINALPIALGISGNPDGRADIRRVWESLDQQQIVRPSKLVRLNMGLWFAAVQTVIVLWLVRRYGPAPERRARVIARIFVGLALPQILFAHMRWSPWRLFGTNHLLHHAWLWSSFGLAWSAWCMLALGLLGLLIQQQLTRRGKHLQGPRQLVRWLLVAAVAGLPGFQLAIVFFYEATLTDGTGIEQALAEKLPALVNRQLQRDGVAALELPATLSDGGRLRELSRQIIQAGLLRRDLVLTGSCLSKTAADLPSDLYFYATARRGTDLSPPAFGHSGVRLSDYPEMLVDVVMGSGSIFPVFPARTLADFPRAGDRVELVDGGFAHNSPIEAAVLWGATHIVLIEASPRASEREGRRNFLQNSIDAFSHLYYQAQLADARSKEKVTIFTLRPGPPHICMLDFANNLVERAIDAGYSEASGEVRSGTATLREHPSWEKSMGEPVFFQVRVQHGLSRKASE